MVGNQSPMPKMQSHPSVYIDEIPSNIGHNHVNETARHGIVAHRLWEENLGNITEVFINDSYRIIAQTLWFCCQNTISERNNLN